MESISLTELVDEQLDLARAAHSGRAAHTVHGGQDHSLRQTVIALAAGHELGEHVSPGEDSCDGSTGDYLVIPAERHALLAVDDSAVLLTVLADQ